MEAAAADEVADEVADEAEVVGEVEVGSGIAY